ncbi:hypothetical protein H0X32_04070 [Patescibacteria group bacterium]|nr:hypothetical protein [Patescibacteria group bacterium]
MADPYLYAFEERVLAGIGMFCRMMWQNAPRSVQRKYARFSMRRNAFVQEMIAYDEADSEVCIPLDTIVYGVLGWFSDVPSIYDGPSLTAQDFGDMLEIASYTNCFLGGNASRGDLTFFLREFSAREMSKKDATTFRETCLKYKSGDNTCLILLLNHLLAGTMRHRKILTPTRERNLVEHAPSLWRRQSEDGAFIDFPLAHSRYHLYSSLLRHLEIVRGTA